MNEPCNLANAAVKMTRHCEEDRSLAAYHTVIRFEIITD